MKKFVVLLFLLPFLSFAQKHSSEAKKLYKSATKAYSDGNVIEALKLFSECVKVDAVYPEAYHNMSLIYYGRKEYDKALDNERIAYHQNKTAVPVLSQLGKCYFMNDMFDSAIVFLDKAINAGDKNEFNHLYLASSYSQTEQYNDAIFHYGRAITFNSENPISYNERGMAYFNIGDYDNAESDFNKTLKLNPSSPAAIYSNLANTMLSKGEPEKALDYINQGIATAEGDEKIQLLILKGNYYFSIGDIDSAEAAFNEAYELDQENPIILTNQATVFMERSEWDLALEKCNMALELDPEMMEAYYNRGITNEMLRNVDDACMDWEQAFILGSEKAEEYLNSATCTE